MLINSNFMIPSLDPGWVVSAFTFKLGQQTQRGLFGSGPLNSGPVADGGRVISTLLRVIRGQYHEAALDVINLKVDF
jgi:hypothetical protein